MTNIERLNKIVNQVIAEDNRTDIYSGEKNLHLRNDLKFDSLALAKLTVLIEDEFGVDIFADGIVFTMDQIFEKLKIN